MIIVSQDKMEIFNFEEIFRLYVDNWSNEEFATEPDCFCIKAEKSSDNMICAFLGKYETEERAKEVLQEIIRNYSSYLELQGGPAILQGQMDIQPNIFNVPKVYEMPINWGDKMNKYYESTKKYLKTPKGVLNKIPELKDPESEDWRE